MRWLLFLFAATTAAAQVPQDVVLDSQPAHYLYKQLLRVAWNENREDGACLDQYKLHGDTVSVAHLTPAHYIRSDTLNIYTPWPICDIGIPTIHTHLLRYAKEHCASQTDIRSARLTHTPFDLIVDVSDYSYTIFVHDSLYELCDMPDSAKRP